jgi:predicted small secreted protein
MKKCLLVLAILSLAACSTMPGGSSQSGGQVQHPDVFHSYIE